MRVDRGPKSALHGDASPELLRKRVPLKQLPPFLDDRAVQLNSARRARLCWLNPATLGLMLVVGVVAGGLRALRSSAWERWMRSSTRVARPEVLRR